MLELNLSNSRTHSLGKLGYRVDRSAEVELKWGPDVSPCPRGEGVLGVERNAVHEAPEAGEAPHVATAGHIPQRQGAIQGLGPAGICF